MLFLVMDDFHIPLNKHFSVLELHYPVIFENVLHLKMQIIENLFEINFIPYQHHHDKQQFLLDIVYLFVQIHVKDLASLVENL